LQVLLLVHLPAVVSWGRLRAVALRVPAQFSLLLHLNSGRWGLGVPGVGLGKRRPLVRCIVLHAWQSKRLRWLLNLHLGVDAALRNGVRVLRFSGLGSKCSSWLRLVLIDWRIVIEHVAWLLGVTLP